MTKHKTVYVVAFEYCSGTIENPEAGGGGFQWFWKPEDADKFWEKNTQNMAHNEAYFRFPYEVDHDDDADKITKIIDDDLIECCARAATRKVGTTVLAYWQQNTFKMGSATEPHHDR